MKRLALLLPLLLPVAASAAEIVINKPAIGAQPVFTGLTCAVKVSFTSTASGIDRKLADGLTEHLKKNSIVDRVTIQPWGKEGELTYCIEAKRGHQPALHVVQTYFRNAGAPTRGTVSIER